MFLFIGIMLKTLKEKYGFKYISCSYLSGSECEMAITEDNLNTSHVLIYQIWNCSQIPFTFNLNTSHVLIYLFGKG